MERNADVNTMSDRYGLLGSAAASVLLHCAAFVILAHNVTLYPVVATPSADDVLWFYPSLLFGTSVPAAPPAASWRNGAGLDDTSASPPASRSVQSSLGSASQAVTLSRELSPSGTAPARPLVSAGPEGLSLVSTNRSGVPEPPVFAGKGAPEVPAVVETVLPRERLKPPRVAERAPAVASSPATGQLSTETAVEVRTGEREYSPVRDAARQGQTTSHGLGGGRERLPPEYQGDGARAVAPGPRVASGAVVPPAVPAAVSREGEGERPRGGVAVAPGKEGAQRGTVAARAVVVPADAARSAGGVPRQSVPAGSAEAGPGGAATRGGTPEPARSRAAGGVTAGVEDGKGREGSDRGRGLFSASIPGDIAFELTSADDLRRGVRVSVGFRDFPRRKRGSPLSRGEATRIRTISPTIVMPGEHAIHAVIDRAAEGVYYLRVEAGQQLADVSVTIRLFAGSSRARNRTVQVGALAGSRTVIRLMMPEGVIWEDPSAFSGSLEDSDSVTRFNAETGMEWKEYR